MLRTLLPLFLAFDTFTWTAQVLFSVVPSLFAFSIKSSFSPLGLPSYDRAKRDFPFPFPFRHIFLHFPDVPPPPPPPIKPRGGRPDLHLKNLSIYFFLLSVDCPAPKVKVLKREYLRSSLAMILLRHLKINEACDLVLFSGAMPECVGPEKRYPSPPFLPSLI